MSGGAGADEPGSRLPEPPADLGPIRMVDVVAATVLWLGLAAMSAVAGVMALLLVMASDGDMGVECIAATSCNRVSMRMTSSHHYGVPLMFSPCDAFVGVSYSVYEERA